MAKYRVLSRPDCKWCDHAKQLLTDRGQEFSEVIHDTPELIEDFRRQGYTTFPQVILINKAGAEWLIGGFTDLLDYFIRLDKSALPDE